MNPKQIKNNRIYSVAYSFIKCYRKYFRTLQWKNLEDCTAYRTFFYEEVILIHAPLQNKLIMKIVQF